MINYQIIDLPRIAIIGKEGLCTKEKNVVQDLWQQANSNFGDIAEIGMKNADGSFVGFWGAMSDETMSFMPWTDGFSRGLYLAGIEVYEDTAVPDGWVKWVMPARKYLVTEVQPENYGEIFGYVMNSLIPELGMKLAGAVCDFTEPATGQNKLFFPIFLVAHDDRWKDGFNEIEKTLTGLLSNQLVVRISHIGSTAIQGIWAKNIIDVMIEIPESSDMKDVARILEQNGFIIMSVEENRISLNKGYTENGFADKVYHIHLRYAGDNDELYFRDYLNEHPDVAKEYEALKLRLWKQYEHNRDAYTDAKTSFISKWTAEARKEYGDRY